MKRRMILSWILVFTLLLASALPAIAAVPRGAAAAGMERIMEAFAVCMKNGEAAASAEAQALVRRLKSHITEHYYTCTDPILAELGRMYVSDERFRQNIDKHGEGTAAFIRDAVEACCGKDREGVRTN